MGYAMKSKYFPSLKRVIGDTSLSVKKTRFLHGLSSSLLPLNKTLGKILHLFGKTGMQWEK